MANLIAYGFHSLKDVFQDKVKDMSVNVIEEAVTLTLEEWDRTWKELYALLIEPTTVPKESYRIPGAGTLQPLTESGIPQLTKHAGSYDVAYPLQRAGDAWGTNRESRAKMTVGQANQNVLDVMRKDNDWLYRHAMAALFTNTTWTYQDDNDKWGSLTIQPLANGDAVVYPRVGGSPATDTHHLANANGLSDANNHYITARNELDEHPDNAGPYVAYIASDLVSATKALADFIPLSDSNFIQYGVTMDLVSDAVNRYQSFGNKVIGMVEDIIIVEARRLPATYFFMVAAGSPPPIVMREQPEAELQGLRAEVDQVNSNFQRIDYYRIAGFGIKRRTNAVVFRVGNGTYAIPSGYAAPLAV